MTDARDPAPTRAASPGTAEHDADDFETVIGLEVHARLKTKTKLFCGCALDPNALDPNDGEPADPARAVGPNTRTCAVCLGFPGALPVANREAVRLAALAALSIGATVHAESVFARKHYFYPDLAKGYQITQGDRPLATEGALVVPETGRRVRIRRLHLEEDAAKSMHVAGDGVTTVDFDRAGAPLVEIVSEPELRSPAEAESYLRALHETLVYAGVTEGELEAGTFRCDANVSLRPRGADALGVRVELKNLNSFRFVRRALELEVVRQSALLASGQKVEQETRGYVEAHDRTESQRSKEEAEDYRYLPDPDLPTLRLDEAGFDLARLRTEVPESPIDKRTRYVASGLTPYDAQVLTAHPAIARYFDDALAHARGRSSRDDVPKRVANFVTSEVLRDRVGAAFPDDAAVVGELVAATAEGALSGSAAKAVLREVRATGEAPAAAIERLGLAQVSDEATIRALVRQAIDAHPAEVAKVRAGKVAIVGFLVGKVMRASGGRASPSTVDRLLREALEVPT